MIVTPLGIVKAVNPLQSANIDPLISVILLGSVTDVSSVHPKHTASPMELTLLGIIIVEIPEQLRKALFPMLITLSGIAKEVNP